MSPPIRSSSAGILSGPTALPGFNDFKAFSISPIEGAGSLRSHLNPSAAPSEVLGAHWDTPVALSDAGVEYKSSQ